jgi:nitrogen fixation-related uncharacterized protein
MVTLIIVVPVALLVTIGIMVFFNKTTNFEGNEND